MLDELKELLRSEAFVGFRIVLNGGGGYDVSSRYQIAIGQTQLTYYFPRSNRKAELKTSEIAAFQVSEPNEPK